MFASLTFSRLGKAGKRNFRIFALLSAYENARNVVQATSTTGTAYPNLSRNRLKVWMYAQ